MSMMTSAAGAAGFTGRAEDLARLAELIRSSGGAILRGPAGIGKSELLRRVAEVVGAELAGPGARVVSIEGNEASGAVPFGPFVPLLESESDEADVPDDPLRIAAALHRRIAGAALMTVDDAHRLDTASAGFVHRLAVEGTPLLIAVRSGEQVPAAIESLWIRGLLVMHEVLPFDLEEVAAFATTRLGPHVDTGLAHALHRASGGNPLFARELLRAAVESGAIDRHREVWVLRGSLAADGDLASVLRSQLLAQSEGVRLAIDCLALAEPLELAQLAALVGDAELDRAEAEGLLRIEDGDRPLVRLGHPLYRGVAFSAMSAMHRRRIADALLRSAESAEARNDPATIAAWRLERGDERPPGEWLEVAQRVQATDQPLAEAFIRAAVAAGGGPPALLALASLLTHQHRLDEALEVFERLAAVPLPPEARVQIAAVEAFLLAMPGQRPEDALALIARITAEYGRSPELESSRALALWRSGRVDDAVPVGRAVAIDETASLRARASAALTVCSAEIYGMRLSDAEFGRDSELMNRLAFEAAAELPEGPESAILVSASRALMPVTEVAAGMRIAAEGGRQALLSGNDGVRAQFAMLHGWAQSLSGDLEGGLERLYEAYAGRGVWTPTTLPWLRSHLVRTLCAAGRVDAAHELYADLEESPRTGLYALDLVLARAAMLDADGDRAAAREELASKTAVHADRAGNRLRGDETWLRRLRLGEDAAAGEVVRRYRRRSGDAAAAIAEHAAGVLESDRAAISRGVSSLASSGLLWDACEAQADLVRRHRAVGDGVSERLAIERLAALFERTRGLAVPAVLAELRPVLTSREREIARLAVALADREIAARLGISERTVQTHLTRVYHKLRIRGRAGLAALLEDEPTESAETAEAAQPA